MKGVMAILGATLYKYYWCGTVNNTLHCQICVDKSYILILEGSLERAVQ